LPGKLMNGAYRAVRSLATRNVVMECDRIPYHFRDVPLSKILNWILVEALRSAFAP
jgi:hypothetical protein